MQRLDLLATAGTELPAYAVVALEAGAVDDCGHVGPAPQAQPAELRPAADHKAPGIDLRPVEDVMLAVDLGVDLHSLLLHIQYRSFRLRMNKLKRACQVFAFTHSAAYCCMLMCFISAGPKHLLYIAEHGRGVQPMAQVQASAL